jgi:hypothetical protein
VAILGIDKGKKIFPAISMADFGAGFSMKEAVHAVHNLLQSGTGGAGIKLEDILSDPMDHGTLYFAERLQTAVLEEMEKRFSRQYSSIRQ